MRMIPIASADQMCHKGVEVGKAASASDKNAIDPNS